ncbi:MAG: NADH-quinone oxidoreductase subunit C [Bacteroidales bacterium]|nr:NADH-quinone oxidoreductase subunit C [Bacteroidales bacterium]
MAEIAEIKEIKKNFKNSITGIELRSPLRATVSIRPDKLVKITEFLYHRLNLRFIIASAFETRQGFEILYHFSNDANGLVLNIHVVLSKKKPEIQSLTGIFEASSWIEREMHETFGINFLNHPNLEKLISEGNWAKGVYPYRKGGK